MNLIMCVCGWGCVCTYMWKPKIGIKWSLSTYILRQSFWLAGSLVFGLVWLPSLS